VKIFSTLLGRALPSLLVASALSACESGRAAAPSERPAFDAARAWKDLETAVGFGPRPAGSASLERLRAYLESELRAVGLEPRREAFTAPTPIGPLDFVNLVVDVPGRTPEAPIVVVGGHIDTKRMPFEFVGANDAGSSTAVLLELARWLAPQRGERPVAYRLLFLDGEEAVRPDWAGEDNLYGSRHHVAELQRTGEIERIAACVIVDMVGDRDLRLTRETNSHRELLEVFFQAARSIDLGKHVDGAPRELYDDHLSFRDAGVAAADLIDFAFGGAHNPYWHSAEDTLEHCSQASLDAIGRILVAGLPGLERWVAARGASR